MQYKNYVQLLLTCESNQMLIIEDFFWWELESIICSIVDTVGACDSLCILYSLTLVNIVFVTVHVYVAGAH